MKLKRGLGIMLVIGLLVLGISAGGLAQEKVKLVTGEWAPYTSSKMANKGAFTEIISAVFKEMDVEPEYEFLPWKRATKHVETGRAWAAFPYSPTKERKKKFSFSDPIMYSTNKFFYYGDGADITYKKLEDLKEYKIGGMQGYFYQDMFAEAGLDVSYVSKKKLVLKKLRHGRIDLLPLDELVGWELIKTVYPDKVDQFGTVAKPLSKDPLNLMVAKDSSAAKERLQKFNKALQKIKDKGIYQKILQKYNIEY